MIKFFQGCWKQTKAAWSEKRHWFIRLAVIILGLIIALTTMVLIKLRIIDEDKVKVWLSQPDPKQGSIYLFLEKEDLVL